MSVYTKPYVIGGIIGVFLFGCFLSTAGPAGLALGVGLVTISLVLGAIAWKIAHSNRSPSLPPLSQGETVKARGNCCWSPGDIQKNGGSRSAIYSTAVNSHHQRQGIIYIPGKCKRNQNGNGHSDRQAGNGTDVDTGKGTCSSQEHQGWIKPAHKEI